MLVNQAIRLESREPHQVGTQTEARTLARREADAGRKKIKKRERHRGNNGAGEHLLHVELLLGDDEAGKSHRETLKKVLDRTRDELSNCETVHTYNLDRENLSDTRWSKAVSEYNSTMSDSSSDKPQVFLEGDEEIRGQKYVCLSFLTPNRGILRNKDLFFFSKFLEFYNMDYKIRATESFIMGQFREIQNALSDVELQLRNSDTADATLTLTLSEKLTKLRGEMSKKTAADLENHVKNNMADFKESSVVETYEKYMQVNRQRLEDEFHKQKNFQTTMHGLKVRGVYSNQEQANAHAKAINKKDPYFNVYVADVGEWLPWDPEPDEVKDQEYQSTELNKLMQSYKENAEKRDAFFEEEKRQKMAKAAAEVAAAKAANANAKEVKKAPTFGEQEGEDQKTPTDMFAATGAPDLAIGRKQEAAASTITYA